MEALDYVIFFIVGVIGCAIHVQLNIRELQMTSRKANVAFKASDYFKEDLLSITISISFLCLVLFFVTDALTLYPKLINWMRGLFAVIGYAGDSLASKLFGQVAKRIADVIDKKTTIADETTGNLNEPTPHK